MPHFSPNSFLITPPTSPHPPSLSSPPPLSSVCDVHLLLGVEPSAATWLTYQGVTHLKKTDSLPQTFLSYAWEFTSPIGTVLYCSLPWSYAGNHSHCARSYDESDELLCPSLSNHWLLQPFCPLFLCFPRALCVGVSVGCNGQWAWQR